MTSTNNQHCIHYFACMRHQHRASAFGYQSAPLDCEDCDCVRSDSELTNCITIGNAIVYAEELLKFADNPLESIAPFAYPMTLGEVLALPPYSPRLLCKDKGAGDEVSDTTSRGA